MTALPPVSNSPQRASAAPRRQENASRSIAKSQTWLLVIAVMQLVLGLGFGIKASVDAEVQLARISLFEPDEPLPLGDGSTITARELRTQVERQRVLHFVLPLAWGAAFVGLWIWAKRAALPAMVCALLLFVTAHAVEAALDPATLFQGIILKVLFVAALIAGIKAAVQQRVAERAAELDDRQTLA